MKSTLRFLVGAVALCLMLLPPLVLADPTPRDCCDVAQELIAKQDAYDVTDERLDSLAETIALAMGLIEQIQARDPFTAEDQEAIDDINRLLETSLVEQAAANVYLVLLTQDIIALNQELLTCGPQEGEGDPITPMPDPLFNP